MKKIWAKILLFFYSFAWGMKGGGKILNGSNKEADDSDIGGIEQQKEAKSVYADLLRGEVTQEVKELRHEMYYAERKSHDYEYSGNGRAVKKNNVFDYSGNIDKSDGLKILIVQDNHEDPTSLMDWGIYSMGENVDLADIAKGNLATKAERNFTISIKRDFIPSMRLEEYATKIVVKEINDKKVQIDIYVSQYERQFDRRSRIFINEIDRIYMGDKRSDVIDFNELGFVSKNAYGSDDLIVYAFNNIQFDNIIKFDGSYVLKFIADKNYKHDIITEFHDDIAAKKNENHEMREGATMNLGVAAELMGQDNYDYDQAKKVIDEFKNE